MTQKTLDLIAQLVAQTQSTLDAYLELQAAAQAQFKMDNDVIVKGISDGVSAALSPVNDAVTAALAKVAPAEKVTP